MSEIERKNPITKFQKDLDSYLKLYNTFLIDGNISDLQPYYLEKRDRIINVSLNSYLKNMYEEDYLIFTYNSDNSEDRRFDILNHDALADFVPDKKSRELIYNVFKIRKLEEDEEDENEESEQEGNDEEQEEPFDEEEFEQQLLANHDNSGASLDIAKLIFLISIDSKIEFKEGKHVMVVCTSASHMAVRPGEINSESEKMTYAAIYQLSQLGIETENRAIFLINKANDLPPWVENESYNINVKKLTIIKPNEELRKIIITELKQHDPYSENRYIQLADEAIKQKDKNDSFESSLTLLTRDFTTINIQRLFDYFELEGDKLIVDNKPIDLDKVILTFNHGVNDSNPWEMDDVYDKVFGIEDKINAELSGQEKVAAKIREILGLAVTGYKRIANKKSPRAVFFLAGPTGTGKTEVTKIIAKEIFGSEEAMIRFDMSEFSQEHTDQRLFGAPPGYVGYDAGGQLTGAVMQNPFSLILFDEVEKAHPRILDKFLQILSDGRLTDGQGRTVSFENCVIVMTSNAGISIPKDKNLVTSVESIPPVLDEYFITARVDHKLANVKTLIELEKENAQPIKSEDPRLPDLELKDENDFYNHFVRFCENNLSYFFEYNLNRKEIYGRLVDSIVVYNYISKKALVNIVDKEVGKIVKYSKDNFALQFDDAEVNSIKTNIVEMANTEETRGLGGRGIIKKIDELLANKVSTAILNARIPAGNKEARPCHLAYDKDKKEITVTLG